MQKNQPPAPNLFGGNTSPLRDIIAQATAPVRKYQQQVTRKQYVPDYARFKLKFYYLDGNSSTHYSYDSFYVSQDGAKTLKWDEQVGLVKLLRLIETNKGKYISAVIWCVMNDDTATATAQYNFEIVKYVRNRSPRIHSKINFTSGRLDWRVLHKANF